MDLTDKMVQLAQDGEQLVKGIDWDALDQQGKGIPLDPSIDVHADYIALYMSPAFDKATRVMRTLYYDPALTLSASTKDAVRTVIAQLEPSIEEAAASFSSGNLWGSIKAFAQFDLVKLRTFISLSYGVAMAGVKMHTAETNYAIAFLDRKSWREHADRVVRILNAISFLDDSGALYWLKWDSDEMKELRAQQGLPNDMKNPGIQGLGAVPLGIIVAAAAVIVALGAIWMWSRTTTEYNEQALGILREICAAPKDDATRDQCVKVLGSTAAQMGNPFAGVLGSVLPYLFAGALIIGGVMFAPTIVRSLLSARRAAKEGA